MQNAAPVGILPVDVNETLLEVPRERLDLTGAKPGCKQRGTGFPAPLGSSFDTDYCAAVCTRGRPLLPTGMYTVVWFGELAISSWAPIASCWR